MTTRIFTGTVVDAVIEATHQADMVSHSQVTDSIVITGDVIDTKCHHTRIVSVGTIDVWASTMTDVVQTHDMAIVETMIILVVDMSIDIEIETYRGAGLAAGQLTPGGHIAQITAGIMLAVALAVPEIVATGAMIEIDAIGLIAHEISVDELTHSNWQLPDVCVSVDKIPIVYGQVATIQAITLVASGRLRHRCAITHRQL